MNFKRSVWIRDPQLAFGDSFLEASCLTIPHTAGMALYAQTVCTDTVVSLSHPLFSWKSGLLHPRLQGRGEGDYWQWKIWILSSMPDSRWGHSQGKLHEPLWLVDGVVPILLRRGTFRWLCLTRCSCGFLFADVSLKMIIIINHNHKNNYCVLNVLQDDHLGVTWGTFDILKPLIYISEYPWSWFRSSSGLQYFYKESLHRVAIFNSCLP